MKASLQQLNEHKTIALFVDGDNFSAELAQPMIEQLKRLGTVPIRRVFGDWAKPNNHLWVERQFEGSFQLVHQSRLTSQGKNSSDIALVVDACIEAFSGRYNAIAIAGQDTDYTPLLIRLGQLGFETILIGDQSNTPDVLIRSAKHYIPLEQPKTQFQPLIRVVEDIEKEQRKTLVSTYHEALSLQQRKRAGRGAMHCNFSIFCALMKRKGLFPEEFVADQSKWKPVLEQLFGEKVQFSENNQYFSLAL